MQTMQGNHRWKEGILTVILLSMLLCTACGRALNDETEQKEPEQQTRTEISTQEPEETENIESKEDTDEQIVFTAQNIPEKIRKLLSYHGWVDDTQAVPCTKEDIENSGMLKEFQQILCGDFSPFIGQESEEGLLEMQQQYENREVWKYVLRDVDEDGIDDLCIKDDKGRMGIVYEVWGELYFPGLIELWTFGEPDWNLLAETVEYGLNYFLLNDATIGSVFMFKDDDETEVYFDLEVEQIRDDGTLETLKKIRIIIVNSNDTGETDGYEKPGIYYYEQDKDSYKYIEIQEDEAIAWCEENIYPYMMREEEWYVVP